MNFKINGKNACADDVHIYNSVVGILVSWAVAKQLNILPECYPMPVHSTKAAQDTHTIISPEQIMSEFPTVF